MGGNEHFTQQGLLPTSRLISVSGRRERRQSVKLRNLKKGDKVTREALNGRQLLRGCSCSLLMQAIVLEIDGGVYLKCLSKKPSGRDGGKPHASLSSSLSKVFVQPHRAEVYWEAESPLRVFRLKMDSQIDKVNFKWSSYAHFTVRTSKQNWSFETHKCFSFT